jgi:hypothetical protein
MEPEGSSLHLQVPTTCPNAEPDQVRAPSHFLKIHLNIIVPSSPGSLRFPHHNPVQPSPLSHSCYIPRPSHSFRFDHPNNIWWGLWTTKLLIMKSPLFRYPLGPNTLLSTLFSNTLSLRSSFNVSDQVSHPNNLEDKTDRYSITDRKINYTLCVETFIRRPLFLKLFEPRPRLGQRLFLTTPEVRNKDKLYS